MDHETCVPHDKHGYDECVPLVAQKPNETHGRDHHEGAAREEYSASEVIWALIQEGNRDRAFRNPCVRVLALAPEQRFSERHFPEEIIPAKEGAKNYRRCNECYTDKGGKYTKYQCGPCKKFLCMWPCFAVYHTKGLTHADAIKACNEQIAAQEACTAGANLGGPQEPPDLNVTV